MSAPTIGWLQYLLNLIPTRWLDRLDVSILGLKALPFWRYVVLMSAICTAGAMAFDFFYDALGVVIAHRDFERWGASEIVLKVIFVFPLIETMLCQTLPAFIIRKRCPSNALLFLATSLPFALAHWTVGLPMVLGPALICGVAFGLTMVVWGEKSLRLGSIAVYLIHASYNGLLAGIQAVIDWL